MPSRSQDAKTCLIRLAFTDGLFEMKKTKRGTDQWQCTILIPKSESLSPLEALCLEAATAEWGEKAMQMFASKLIKSPFLDGDGPQGKSKKTGEPHAGFPGHWFLRTTSGKDYRPKMYDRKKLLIDDKTVIYSGAYAYAVVNAYTWDNPEQGKGLSFGLSMIQFVKDGERLGGAGGGDPDEYFEELPDEGAAPASVRNGAGAKGLFG